MGASGTTLQSLTNQTNIDFDTPFQFTSLGSDARATVENWVTPARELAQQRRELERASTDLDRQRAVRASARAGTEANVSNQDNRDSIAGAAVSGDVKRLAIRADRGADGQGRLQLTEGSRRDNEPGTARGRDNDAQVRDRQRGDRAGADVATDNNARANVNRDGVDLNADANANTNARGRGDNARDNNARDNNARDNNARAAGRGDNVADVVITFPAATITTTIVALVAIVTTRE